MKLIPVPGEREHSKDVRSSESELFEEEGNVASLVTLVGSIVSKGIK